MSNLPKIGDTIKTGTLEEMQKIDGIGIYDRHLSCEGKLGVVTPSRLIRLGGEYEIYSITDTYFKFDLPDDTSFFYPIWAYEALLKPTKQPKKSPLEKERDQLEARLALVNEGIKLESEVKSGAKELKAKRARLAVIRKGDV